MREKHSKKMIKLVISTCEQFKKESYKYVGYILAVLWFKYEIDNLKEVRDFGAILASRNSKDIISKLDKIMMDKGLISTTLINDVPKSFQEQGGIIIRTLLENIEISNLSFSEEEVDSPQTIKEVFSFLTDFFAKHLNCKEKNFYIPESIIELVKKIIDVENIDVIYDIACGSGELLYGLGEIFPRACLYGQENREDVYALCKINSLVNMATKKNNSETYIISNRYNIKNRGLVQADVVVGNLLFPVEVNRATEPISLNEARSWVNATNIRGEYGFIIEALKSLKDNGQAILVVPQGVLFRSGGEQTIREKMIEMNLIDLVIGLPAQMFYNIENPPCILVLRKNKRDTNILFVDASNEYRTDEGINKLDSEVIDKLCKAIKEKRNECGYSYKATLQEIKSNQYNLNIGRYITSVVDREENIDNIANQIIQIENKLSDLKIKTDLLMQQA